jgi:hypothetical protein
MSEGIVEVVKKVATFVTGGMPGDLAIPDSVADPEAIHAVQKHCDEVGFACDEDTARSIVQEAR